MSRIVFCSLVLALLLALPCWAADGPHYWRVTVTYADGTGYYAERVTELHVDTEAGEIIIRWDVDADGLTGVNLDLFGATVEVSEAVTL